MTLKMCTSKKSFFSDRLLKKGPQTEKIIEAKFNPNSLFKCILANTKAPQLPH